MSGATSRRRGHTAERGVAKYLRSRGYVDAHTTRSQLGHDGFHAPGDVVGIPGVVIEVKDVASSAFPSWCAQAAQEAQGRPWVVVRKKRGTADVGDWQAIGSEQWAPMSPLLRRRRPRPTTFAAWLDWWESDR
jgi:hypothetical protein